jgi:GNAT superfamily N-acetyltransferase
MPHPVILTKGRRSGKTIRIRSAVAKLRRDNNEQITCLQVAANHSVTYHQRMGRVRIRFARSGDCRALAELRYQFRAEAGPVTESKSRFLRRCASWMKTRFRPESRPWRCWVIDDGKQLLGHVCVQLFEKVPNPISDEPELHAYVTNFYVVPEMRSQGFGRTLLDKALSWCRAQGTDSIILWATPESRPLYRRCGLAEPADIFELRHATGPPRSPR